MDSFTQYLTAHPAVAIVLAVLLLLVIYFVIRQALKLVLLFGLILIAVAGYSYYKAPEEFPQTVREAVTTVKEHTETLVEKGKEVVEKGKEMAEDLGKAVKTDKEKVSGK